MIIGTAGHIDHGKTTLVKLLTGVDTDRLQEEKQRGISIDLGYAYLPLRGGEVLGFVDVPGHERFIRNMLAGATGIDFMLLVVAADDGVMPQTVEHLHILELLGVKRGAVALTKCDRVDAQRVVEAGAQIESLLRGTPLAESRVYPLSARTGNGVDALRRALGEEAASFPRRDDGGLFRLSVDRSFSLPGCGTVVTGAVFSGSAAVGDTLTIGPAGLPARVRSIHAQNRAAADGHTGERCALNLVGVRKQQVQRGDWVLDPALLAPTSRFDARLRVLADAKPLRHWMSVHLHLGAGDVPARVALLEGEVLQPGTQAHVQLVSAKPLCTLRGDRFIVRDQSGQATLGGGMVLDPFAPARRRRSRERLAALAALEHDVPEAALAALLEASPDGVHLDRFVLAWNLTPADAEALWKELKIRVPQAPAGKLGFSGRHWSEGLQRAHDVLSRLHAGDPAAIGFPLQAFAEALPQASRRTLGLLAEELVASRRAVRVGKDFRLSDHRGASPADPLREKVAASVSQALVPPDVQAVAKTLHVAETRVRAILEQMRADGGMLRVERDLYLAAAAGRRLAECAQQLAAANSRGQFTLAEFRDRIGAGRRFAVKILEWFDRIGFTARSGDAHTILNAALFERDKGRDTSPGGAAGLQIR
ncbi:MAG: selenocysteine-specific translation elongation factor [Betaproteobacteria bacterium]|nr:selenocysteine-specific translation elongation factor [Betaproteobacteria bacterium]